MLLAWRTILLNKSDSDVMDQLHWSEKGEEAEEYTP